MHLRMSHIAANAHHPRQLKRAQIEEILALAEYLPPRERVLIEHVLDKGVPLARIAKLYQRSSRQLQRQAESIIKRLSKRMFRFVALHMSMLPAETRSTARHVVLYGLSLRQTSITMETSIHHVRMHMNVVHAAARLLA